MSAALIVLGGIAYIGLSLWFKFTPRLRVVVALVVGGLLAGVVATRVNGWLADGCAVVAKPLGRLIGQPAGDVTVAIPSVVAFVLAVIVIVFLRRRGGGHTGGGKSHGGGGGRAGGLATAALVCALLLPIVAGSIGEAIRSVSS
jgi:ABC-type phosphate transport system permease subunit